MSALPVVIVGGSGKTGARVDARLRARGIATRPVSRTSSVRFDWTAPETWPAALERASCAYVTYQPDLAVRGAPEAITAFARLARESGIERVVLLSGRGEPGAQAAEAALQASGVGWGVVRASWFNQNFSEGYLLDSVLAGEVALPAGAVREPFVDADDIADVAVAALTDARFANRMIEVTGPRALTFAEAVDEIARGGPAGPLPRDFVRGVRCRLARSRRAGPDHRVARRTVRRGPRRSQQRRRGRGPRHARAAGSRLRRVCARDGRDRRVARMTMIALATSVLLWGSAIGCGLMAGVYFAFSTFVMRSLARIAPAAGVAAMNAINVEIVRSPFMPLFLGTTLSALALAVIALVGRAQPGAIAIVAGAALYVAGMFAVTMAVNVPLNDALASVDPATTQGAALWSRYLHDWTRWNHVRMVASAAACVCFIVAIVAR